MKKAVIAAVVLALAAAGSAYAQRSRGGGSSGPSAGSVDAVVLSGGGAGAADNAALQSKLRAVMRQVLATPAFTNLSGYQVKLYAGYGGKRGDQSSFSKGPLQVEGDVGITKVGGAGDLPNIKVYLNSPLLLKSAGWTGEPDVFSLRSEMLDPTGVARIQDGKTAIIHITKPGRPVVLPLTKTQAGALETAGLRRALAAIDPASPYAKTETAYAQKKIADIEASLARLSPAQLAQPACRGEPDRGQRYDCRFQTSEVYAQLNPDYLKGASKGAVRSITVALNYTSNVGPLASAMNELDTQALQRLLD